MAQIVALFAEALAEGEASDEQKVQLKELAQGKLSNGYWYGKAGMARV